MGPILLINLSKRFGGADVRVMQLARALEGRHQYGVATLSGSPLHKKLINEHLNALPVSMGRGDPRLAISIYRMIKHHGFVLIDTHNPQSHFWGGIAARWAGTAAKVSTVHSSRDNTIPAIKSLLHEKVLQLNCAFQSRYIAVSHSVSDYLTGLNIKAEKIRLIPNAIRPQKPLAHDQKTSVRYSFGWNNDHFVVICVGRLEPVKGYTFLLHALKTIVKSHPLVRCLVVGDGRQRKSLEIQVRALNLKNVVHFTGFRDDVTSLLAAGNAFCMPSISEGLPFAALEACMAGLPLVVTRVGGLAEFFINNQTAVLVEPKNPKALSKGLKSIIDSPQKAKALGKAAHKTACDNFSFERMISQTMSLYNTAVNQGQTVN